MEKVPMLLQDLGTLKIDVLPILAAKFDMTVEFCVVCVAMMEPTKTQGTNNLLATVWAGKLNSSSP